jgi:hypothetical protein
MSFKSGKTSHRESAATQKQCCTAHGLAITLAAAFQASFARFSGSKRFRQQEMLT